MNVSPTELPEVLLVEPRAFGDARGYLVESWHAARYAANGIPDAFVQDNVSYSTRGVLRGLHLQHPDGQAKLVSVLRGAIYDVAVDVRRGSPTFGRWVGATLSAENRRQLYIPTGFAHGFLVTDDDALVTYKASAAYRPEAELAIRWDDPELGIAWPLDGRPTVSARDAAAPTLGAIALHDAERLPSLAFDPTRPVRAGHSDARR